MFIKMARLLPLVTLEIDFQWFKNYKVSTLMIRQCKDPQYIFCVIVFSMTFQNYNIQLVQQLGLDLNIKSWIVGLTGESKLEMKEARLQLIQVGATSLVHIFKNSNLIGPGKNLINVVILIQNTTFISYLCNVISLLSCSRYPKRNGISSAFGF